MLVYGYILLSLHLLARYKQYDRRHVFSRFLLDKKIPKFLKILKRRERAPTRRTIFLEKKSWKESTARFTSECGPHRREERVGTRTVRRRGPVACT